MKKRKVPSKRLPHDTTAARLWKINTALDGFFAEFNDVCTLEDAANLTRQLRRKIDEINGVPQPKPAKTVGKQGLLFGD